jgi:hypothetical protein
MVYDSHPAVVIERSKFNLTVFGQGFEETIYCRIGDVNIMANLLSTTEILCPISIGLEPGSYIVSLLLNDFSGVISNLMIQVERMFTIESIFPKFGPFRGGTEIFVHGIGFKAFQNKLSCKFGSFAAGVMHVHNDTSGTCFSPSLNEVQHFDAQSLVDSVKTQFSLDLDPSHFSSSDFGNYGEDIAFLFYRDEIIDSVQPALISVHGSFVHILGKWFTNSSMLACKVGNSTILRATYVDDRAIKCFIPDIERITTKNLESQVHLVSVPISVSNNGVDFDDSKAIRIFYYNEPVITSVDPLIGPPGTEIFITASDSFRGHSIKCRFGDIVSNSILVKDNRISCRSPSDITALYGLPINVDFGLSVNQNDYTSIGTFTFTELPTITNIIPSHGSIHGQYDAVIYGTNFDMLESHVFCKFDESFAPVTILSAQRLKCAVPPHNITNTVKVDLFSLRNYSLVKDSEVTFTYLEDFYISSIHPTFGTIKGGTKISITGLNFSKLLGLGCIFDSDTWTDATVLSATQAICTVPELLNIESMIAILKLGVKHRNGFTFLTSNGVMYQYTFVPEIYEIYPSRAMISGGDPVMIFGSKFTYPGSNESVNCAFGDKIVKGKWLSHETIYCVTPSVPDSFSEREVHTLEVRRNKDQLLNCSFIHFVLEFEKEFSRTLNCDASEIDIMEALQELNTVGLVTVTKRMFEGFNDILVTAYNVTFTTLGSPVNGGPLDPIRIHLVTSIDGINTDSWVLQKACCDIKISVNGLDFHQGRDNSRIPFTFDKHALVHSVVPNHGPIKGGTKLNVYGVGIPDPSSQNSEVYCVMGGEYVMAIYVNSSYIKCTTPAFEKPLTVTVSIAINTKVSGAGRILESLAVFEYVFEPIVFTTFPKTLPQSPSLWTNFEIYGEHFVHSDQLKCHFEHLDNNKSIKILGFETSAQLIHDDIIRCNLFNILQGRKIHSAYLYASVTTNGYDFSNSIPIRIIDPHAVLSLNPSFGTIGGGTEVFIEGTNFIKSDELACKFGDTLVPGIFVSSSGIVCKSPAVSQSELTLEVTVTIDGYHFSESSKSFSYYEGGVINMIDPNIGPSSGGTIVTIHYQATKSDDSVFLCDFNNTFARAEVIGLSTLQCVSPPANNASGGFVPLTIYRNGVEMIGKDITFLYLSAIKSESLTIYPNHGPNTGGTSVRVTGLPLAWTENYVFSGKCRFNEIIVNASIAIDETESIICISPIKGNDTVVLVDVSMTGQLEDFTDIGAVFIYDDSVSIVEIQPNYGPASGNTDVSIRGGVFPRYYKSQTQCMFGDQLVSAKWLSESNIVCKSPPISQDREVQNVAIYSMAWNYAIQTISIVADDFSPEIHSIYTFTNKEMKNEIQRLSIKTSEKDDNFVYRLQANAYLDNAIEIDLRFQSNMQAMKTMLLRTFVMENHSISGGFELFIENDEGKVSSGILQHDISVDHLKDAILLLDDSLTDLTVDQIYSGSDGTRHWKISIPSSSHSIRFQVNGNSLIGEGSGIHLRTESHDVIREIQKISLSSFSKTLSGNFSVAFKEHQTETIPWDTNAESLVEILERLPSIGLLSISHSPITFFSDVGMYKSDWLITFLTYNGNAPPLFICCDSSSDSGRQSIHDIQNNDDVNFSIIEIQRGVPDIKGEETFQIRLYGRSDGCLATNHIPLQATSESVVEIIEESSFIKRGTTKVVKTFIDNGNRLPRFKITFEPLFSQLSTIMPSESMRIEISSSLQDKYVEFNQTSYALQRVMYLLEFKDKVGIISCSDDMGQFNFSSQATNEMILESIKETFLHTNEEVLFDVVVESLLKKSSLKQLIISNIPVRGSLQCSEDVIVRKLDNGQSPNIAGGDFTISIYTNRKDTVTIPYNISNSDLENLFGNNGLNVSVSSEKYTVVSRSWLITFLNEVENESFVNMTPKVALEAVNLIGFHPTVQIQLLGSVSLPNESYRIQILHQWTRPIYLGSNAKVVESAVNALTGVHVQVEEVHNEGFEYSFLFQFVGYVGEEPTGYIPTSAGNIAPLIAFSTSSKLGFFVETLQNGTNPLKCSGYPRCFRLLTPNVYPGHASTDTFTRWISHNETAEDMKEALESSINHKNVIVERIGPYRNGTYEWRVLLPESLSFEGKTWQVVHTEGLSSSNVSTALIAIRTMKLAGHFQLKYLNSRDHVLETTNKIFMNASSSEIERELEMLSSIGDVNVTLAPAAGNDVGKISLRWDIVFLSLRNAGKQPPLTIVSDYLEGTNIQVSVHSKVEGESDNVYVMRKHSMDTIRIYLGQWISHLLFNPSAETIAAELFQMSGHNFIVERNENGDFIEIFILSLSYAITEGSLGLISDCTVEENMQSDKGCGDYTVAEVWKNKTFNSVDGDFSLLYDTCDDSELNIFSCAEKTKSLLFWSSASEIESALEQLNLINDVKVSIQEGISLQEIKGGKIGVIRNFRIELIDAKACGENVESYSYTENIYQIPLLRVRWTNFSGSSSLDPNSLERKSDFVHRETVAALHTSSVPVRISFNGKDFYETEKTFSFVPKIDLLRIHPNKGKQGTLLLLEPRHTINSSVQLYCYFHYSNDNFQDVLRVPIQKPLIQSPIYCAVPTPPIKSIRNKIVRVFLGTINGLDTDSSHQSFIYEDHLAIHHVFPMSGPSHGGFIVTVQGGPFSIYDETLCKFGTTVVNAHWVNVNKVRCVAPEKSIGDHKLTLSRNSQDFSKEYEIINFFHDIKITSIYPYHGPLYSAGTTVIIKGTGFVNTGANVCRFGLTIVPATVITNDELLCETPILDFEFQRLPLSSHNFHLNSDNNTAPIFPLAHSYPFYLSKQVDVQVSMNGQDFIVSALPYVYQDDIFLISSENGHIIGTEGSAIFVQGFGFVNSTELSCRFGGEIVNATFLNGELILCIVPSFDQITSIFNGSDEATVYLEASNNGVDFSNSRTSFTYDTMLYRGEMHHETSRLKCPRGTFCKNELHHNFTLCPKGTYQSQHGQSECIRCPIGFTCPEEGLINPRICPAGYVCDIMGIEVTDHPCPPGYHCDEGTASTHSFCTNDAVNGNWLERSSTPNEFETGHMHQSVYNKRKIVCFDNSTQDFGLQMSVYPARFWDERRILPLDASPLSTGPNRGRFCLPEECHYINSNIAVKSNDSALVSLNILLKRPRPCPRGTYCHSGTTSDKRLLNDLTKPQPCGHGVNCAEASSSPKGIDECPPGFYCRFGQMFPCKVGTYCPVAGTFDPIPCEPGRFNYMVGQTNCTNCPIGHFCAGYGRIEPTLCKPGFVCSETSLSSPNIICPAGYYCPIGTQTSDPFRNDTTLRPYPCPPGTYCLSGTGFRDVLEGNFSHPQPCIAGFYCESGTQSARGTGVCPKGFFCPKGTSIPQPTPTGHFTKYEGSIKSTVCLPGFYAPTIESKECYPCPPGAECLEEGLSETSLCPPGTYRGSLEDDGASCLNCPQGSWSRNWNLRDEGECTSCPPGVTCPLEGTRSPCSSADLPLPFEPVVNLNGVPVLEYMFSPDQMPSEFSVDECLQLNGKHGKKTYHFGELVPPYIDILGRGPHFRPTDELSIKYGKRAKCFVNLQPKGSIIYERSINFFGPQYDIATGSLHQGYGIHKHNNPTNGIGYIPLLRHSSFRSQLNCTPGFSLMNSTLVRKENQIVYTSKEYDYEGGVDVIKCPFFDKDLNCFVDPSFQMHKKGECCEVHSFKSRAIYIGVDQFYPGTCEADIICSSGDVSEAVACQEGYVCGERTSSSKSDDLPCALGFICKFGTTPDSSLEATYGQFNTLCPQGFFCPGGIGTVSRDLACPKDYFCPTGTGNPLLGTLADDAIVRRKHLDLNMNVSMFRYRNLVFLHNLEKFQLQNDHDYYCHFGNDDIINERYDLILEGEEEINQIMSWSKQRPINRGIWFRNKCARDSKWKHVDASLRTNECDCHSQMYLLATLFRFWKVRKILCILDIQRIRF